MQLVEHRECQLEAEEEQRHRDKGIQCKKPVGRQHNHQHYDELQQIGHEIREPVAEKPVNRGRVVVDLRHQTAGLAVGEKGKRQRADGGKNRLFQVVHQLGGNLGGDDAVDQRHEQRHDAHTDDQQHHLPDFTVETAALRQYVVIKHGVGYVRRQNTEGRNHHKSEHNHRNIAAVAEEHPAQPLDEPHLIHALRTDPPLDVGIAHPALGTVMIGFGFLIELFLVDLSVAHEAAVSPAKHVRIVLAGVGKAEQLGFGAVVFTDGHAAADKRLHVYVGQLFLLKFRVSRLGKERLAVPRVGKQQLFRPADDDRAFQHTQPVGKQRDVNVLEHHIDAEVGAHRQHRVLYVSPMLAQTPHGGFRQLLEYDHRCIPSFPIEEGCGACKTGGAAKWAIKQKTFLLYNNFSQM